MSRFLTSIQGRRLSLGVNHELICPQFYVAGDEGSQVDLPSPNRVVLYDDFTGPVLEAAKWAVAHGSDGSCADFAYLAGVNGLIQATTGAGAGASQAANGVELISALQWQSQQGHLIFEAKVALSAITNVALFVGLTDNLSLEAAITGSGTADGITTNATDAVGFVFDTSMTTKNFWLTGVANDVDATAQDTGVAPVAATYNTFRIELDKAGTVAKFFLDGKSVGSLMAGALTKTVSLTPCVNAFARAAASRTVTVDYVHTAADRS